MRHKYFPASIALGYDTMQTIETSVKIKDMPLNQRPREKLIKFGADTLTDAELVAILISSGTKEKSAIMLAEEILNTYGSFRGLAGRDIEEVQKINGLKDAKVASIAAAFEIARRIVNEVRANE